MDIYLFSSLKAWITEATVKRHKFGWIRCPVSVMVKPSLITWPTKIAHISLGILAGDFLCFCLPPSPPPPGWPPLLAKPPFSITLPFPLCSCCSICLPNTCISHLRPLLHSDTWLNCSSNWVCTGATWVRLIGCCILKAIVSGWTNCAKWCNLCSQICKLWFRMKFEWD